MVISPYSTAIRMVIQPNDGVGGVGLTPRLSITVGGETRGWKEGEAIVFDDSFEHEVTHSGKIHHPRIGVTSLHPGQDGNFLARQLNDCHNVEIMLTRWMMLMPRCV